MSGLTRVDSRGSNMSQASNSSNKETQPPCSPYSVAMALAGVSLCATVVTMGLGLGRKISMTPAYMMAPCTAFFAIIGVCCPGRRSSTPRRSVASDVTAATPRSSPQKVREREDSKGV